LRTPEKHGNPRGNQVIINVLEGGPRVGYLNTC
jgi:hypothetical protein